jgi:hypothetical protein
LVKFGLDLLFVFEVDYSTDAPLEQRFADLVHHGVAIDEKDVDDVLVELGVLRP